MDSWTHVEAPFRERICWASARAGGVARRIGRCDRWALGVVPTRRRCGNREDAISRRVRACRGRAECARYLGAMLGGWRCARLLALIQVVRACVDGGDAEHLKARVGSGADEIAQLVPELNTPFQCQKSRR